MFLLGSFPEKNRDFSDLCSFEFTPITTNHHELKQHDCSLRGDSTTAAFEVNLPDVVTSDEASILPCVQADGLSSESSDDVLNEVPLSEPTLLAGLSQAAEFQHTATPEDIDDETITKQTGTTDQFNFVEEKDELLKGGRNESVSEENDEEDGDQDNSLFVHDSDEESSEEQDQNTSPSKHRSRKRPFEEEDEEYRVEEVNVDHKKLKQDHASTTNTNDPAAQGMFSKFRKASKKSDSGVKKRGRKSKQAVNSLKSLQPLNLNEISKRNAALPEVPTFRASTRRSEALKDLFRNVDAQGGVRDYTTSDINRACQAFAGKRQVRTDVGGGKFRVLGMIASLDLYQLLAVEFLRNREKEGAVPRGGILGDEMGLGKTVMMLTLIVNSRLEETGPTLIVCPKALQAHWEKSHVEHCEKGILPLVCRYSGVMQMSASQRVAILEQCNIVLATYEDILGSWPPKNAFDTEPDDTIRARLWEERKGPAHRVLWRRIVLDEFTRINNPTSQSSMACRALRGERKWLVSGTPVLNRNDEFFAGFNFLGVPYCDDLRTFKDRYLKSTNEEDEIYLKLTLDEIMLRRTSETTIFGTKIQERTDVQMSTITVPFSPVERNVYNNLLSILRNIMAKSDGRTEKSRKTLFGCLTLLRAVVSHFLLLARQMDFFTSSDLDNFLDSTPNSQRLNYVQLQTILKEVDGIFPVLNKAVSLSEFLTGASEAEETYNEELSEPHQENPFEKSGRSKTARAPKAEPNHFTLCGHCKQRPTDPYLTDCGHVHCQRCMLEEAGMHAEERSKCGHCRSEFQSSMPWVNLSKDNPQLSIWVKNEKKPKVVPTLRLIEQRLKYLKDYDVLPTSAKVRATIRLLQEWLHKDDGKIVVFVQFMGTMGVLQNEFNRLGWKYCIYHGKQKQSTRDKTLELFAEDPSCRIMLMSLKVGGVGLNLQMANRVILVDLWYNSGIESQAFFRVWRRGQTKPVEVVRIMVRGSIDDRLEAIQQRKRTELGDVMEGDALDFHSYTAEDYEELLAHNTEDAIDIEVPGTKKVRFENLTQFFANEGDA